MNKQVPKNCSRHGSDKYVKFDVHIDDDEDNLSEPDHKEFVGTFVNLFHGQGHNIKVTSFKVGISKVLDCLEAEEDDVVLVTLVPKVGKRDVIIGGIKVEFIPKSHPTFQVLTLLPPTNLLQDQPLSDKNVIIGVFVFLVCGPLHLPCPWPSSSSLSTAKEREWENERMVLAT
ncbi:Polyphenol oxidase, chloroplastic, partial [Glycine soja]